MTSDRTTLPARRTARLCWALICAAAMVFPGQASAESEVLERDRVRADLALELVNRTFDLSGPSDVLFDSPYYAGLRLGISAFPVAIFARDHVAAGLGIVFEISKHPLNTVAAVELDDETYDFDVPTRHDVTFFGAIYEWRVSEQVTITPSVGWRAVEVALGYNPLYRNSFYRGVEVGARGDFGIGVDGLTLGLGLMVRPGVDLGSTVEPYGATASSFGLGIDGGLRYRSKIGIYGAVSTRWERYSTTYRPDRNEGRDDSTSTDRFQSFIFALGYAY